MISSKPALSSTAAGSSSSSWSGASTSWSSSLSSVGGVESPSGGVVWSFLQPATLSAAAAAMVITRLVIVRALDMAVGVSQRPWAPQPLIRLTSPDHDGPPTPPPGHPLQHRRARDRLAPRGARDLAAALQRRNAEDRPRARLHGRRAVPSGLARHRDRKAAVHRGPGPLGHDLVVSPARRRSTVRRD